MPRHAHPNPGTLKTAGDLASASRVPGGWRRFAPEEISKLHRLYYDPKVRVSKIAAAFGVSTSTLLRWIDEMDWPCRRQMKRDAIDALRGAGQEMRAGAPDNAAFGAAAQDGAARGAEAAYAARVARELAAIEAGAEAAGGDEDDALPDVAPEDFPALCVSVGETTLRTIARVKAQRGGDPAATARTLASLVRTLAALEELRGRRGDPTGAVPGGAPARPTRSLEELRGVLAERLARYEAERTEGG